MADRTAARIFGDVFELLAKSPTDENKKLAKAIDKMSQQYDFNQYQMECDESLKKLGIAVESDEDDE